MRYLARLMLVGLALAIAPAHSWAAGGAQDRFAAVTDQPIRQTAAAGFDSPVTGTPTSMPGYSPGSGTPEVGQPIWIVQIHF
jgi:hypothetical protein